MRLNSNGTVNSTFGAQGMLITSVSDAEGGSIILVRPDGSFLIEDKYVSSGEKTAIVRFTAAGKIDSTFGVAGYIRTSSIGTLALQSDGKILLAGKTLDPKDVHSRGNSHPAARQRNPRRRLWNRRQRDARAADQFPESFWDAALVTADGKIIVGGDFGGQAVMARYTAGGMLDSTFGSAGAIIKDLFPFSYISSVRGDCVDSFR